MKNHRQKVNSNTPERLGDSFRSGMFVLTANDLRPGTILRDRDGCWHKVLGKRGELWSLSKRNAFRSFGHLWTLDEINERGNRIV